MLQGLSLLPSLAVAGVTTSVSLATAMGGVQSLPQAPVDPPVVAVVAPAPTDPVEPAGGVAARVLAEPTDEVAATIVAVSTPSPTAAPSSAPTTAVAAVTSTAKPTAAPTPVPTAAPAPASTPASQCTTWLYQGWTINWCTTANPSVYDWTATYNGTTYSGTYNTATGTCTGTYPSTWSSNWESSGPKPGHGHH